jgi:hypothetical protein
LTTRSPRATLPTYTPDHWQDAKTRPRKALVSLQGALYYHVEYRRVPVWFLPGIATALAGSVEELIGQRGAARAKRGPAPKLQQRIERIQRLPRAKKRFVRETLATVIQQVGC